VTSSSNDCTVSKGTVGYQSCSVLDDVDNHGVVGGLGIVGLAYLESHLREMMGQPKFELGRLGSALQLPSTVAIPKTPPVSEMSYLCSFHSPLLAKMSDRPSVRPLALGGRTCGPLEVPIIGKDR